MTGDEDIDTIMRGVAAAPAVQPHDDFRSLVGAKIGNYQITRLIGRGGMGAVYLGEHPLIGKKVAVKVLHDELAQNQEVVARFFTEAKAVNDIHHEHIVDISDFGQTKDEAGRDRAYILMELLDGESLGARLRGGLPSPQELVHILYQAAGALAASHAKKIIHRDIKPDNIFLTRRSHDPCFVKLLDFGIVKLTGHDSPWKTRTGAVLGTPLYMSPEQCAGHGRIDPRSDIYSLGVVMYELLTGRVPFAASGLADILRGHLTEQPQRPSAVVTGVPAALETIVMKCLQKDPAARFSSMKELRAALKSSGWYQLPSAAADSDPAAAAPASRPLRRTTLSGASGELSGSELAIPRRKAPLLVAVGGLLVAALIAVVALRRPAPPPVAVADQTPVRPVAATVHIRIDSSPPGALIRRAGVPEPIGTTPFALTLKQGDPAFDVTLALPGWKDETRTVSSARDQDLIVALSRVEPPAATRKPPAARVRGNPRPARPTTTPKPANSGTLDDGLL